MKQVFRFGNGKVGTRVRKDNSIELVKLDRNVATGLKWDKEAETSDKTVFQFNSVEDVDALIEALNYLKNQF